MVTERVRLFISHSSDDAELASRLIDLVRGALNLPSQAIRCTSIDGHRLPAGANTDEQLRREVHDAEAFIGIVSTKSLRSLYVLFELGARWGAGKHLIPLLAPVTPPSVLGGPLAGLNALQAERAAQVQQLVTDLAAVLGLVPDMPASYQRFVDAVVQTPPAGSMDEAVPTTPGATPVIRAPRFRRALSPDERDIVLYLPDESWELLREAGKDRNGFVLISEHLGGMSVEANDRNFVEQGNPRSEAKWRRAVEELAARGILEPTSYEGDTFRITDLGYRVLDAIETPEPDV